MNYSKTQRILLLIDINPLLHLQNPNPYLNSIQTASKIFIFFPPLSASLFAFKFFFSSLSPLRSSSALHFLSNVVSFNRPSHTLDSLSGILNSLSSSSFEKLKEAHSLSQASNTVKSLLQLLHDYDWEAMDIDNVDSVSGNYCDFPNLSSNLVVLFSPVYRSITCLAEFVALNISDGVDSVFYKHFGVVTDIFVSKDIRVSWVDVRYENLLCITNDLVFIFKDWRCNGKGYVAFCDYINRPRNWENMHIATHSTTPAQSGNWMQSLGSIGQLSLLLEGDSWSTSRVQSNSQALSRSASLSSGASDTNIPRRKAEPAYSFVGMHCIFDQCKAMGWINWYWFCSLS